MKQTRKYVIFTIQRCKKNDDFDFKCLTFHLKFTTKKKNDNNRFCAAQASQ